MREPLESEIVLPADKLPSQFAGPPTAVNAGPRNLPPGRLQSQHRVVDVNDCNPARAWFLAQGRGGDAPLGRRRLHDRCLFSHAPVPCVRPYFDLISIFWRCARSALGTWIVSTP